MKSKNRKRLTKESLGTDAIRIQCKYCLDFDTCIRKVRKVSDEKKGIRTFCVLTPNKSKKTLKKLTNKK